MARKPWYGVGLAVGMLTALATGANAQAVFKTNIVADPAMLDEHVASVGGWVTSTLVRLGDLDLEYLPPDEEDEDDT